PKNTVDLCTKYVKSCQNADGGFMYQKLTNTQSIWPRSSAGLVALYSAGIYEGKEIEMGLKFLMDHMPRGEVFRHEAFYFYGHYYAVQAMWHAGGAYWRQWYPAIRDELLGRQTHDGSWPDLTVNSEYGTAMACIVLQMPNNYLPIFQR
ncbi:MAG TPA: prenyltransferase, partial [Planctomycetaceae bacterium]|nr:prenyltransferase [Planctomycetaceae bacterium]